MGWATTGSYIIVSVAAIATAYVVIQQADQVVDTLREARDEASALRDTLDGTEMSILQVTHDGSTQTVSIVVRNVGASTLDPTGLSVVLDGRVVDDEVTVEVEDDPASGFWPPTRNATVNATPEYGVPSLVRIVSEEGAVAVWIRESPGALSLNVLPHAADVTAGETQQYTLRAFDRHGNEVSVTGVRWSTDGGAVSSTGLLTTQTTAGTGFRVHARVGALKASATYDIVAGPLDHVHVDPPSHTFEQTDPETFNFTAVAHDQYHNPRPPGDLFTWSVVNGGGWINNTYGAYDETGEFTTDYVAGTYWNTVKLESGAATPGHATVYTNAGPLDHVHVVPQTNSTTAGGPAMNYTAVGHDVSHNERIGDFFTWSVVNGGGTVSPSAESNYTLFTPGTVAGTYAGTVRAEKNGYADTATAVVDPAALDAITVSPASGATTAGGEAIVFTATPYDEYGNERSDTIQWAVVNGGGTIDNATGATTTFTPGTTAGTYTQTLRAYNGAVETRVNVTIHPGPLDSFTITGAPATATAGDGLSSDLTVTAYDAFGNVKTDYTGDVNFTSSDPQAAMPANYTFTSGDAGVHTFAGSGFVLKTTGSRTFTVKDRTETEITGTTTAITVAPAGIASFTVSGEPASTTAGDPFPGPLTVTAYDGYGNVKTDYEGTVNFTSTDPQAAMAADHTFLASENGAHDFPGADFVLKTAGSRTLSVKDTVVTSATGTSGSVTVNPGPLSQLTLTGEPDAVAAGDPFPGDVTVEAADAYGNVKTDYTGTVNFTSTDPGAALPADYTFTVEDAGSHAFPGADFALRTTPSQTVTVTDTVQTEITGTTSAISVAPCCFGWFTLSGEPASVTAGDAFPAGLTVTVYDAFGNVQTNYTGLVRFGSTDAQADLPADYQFTLDDAGTRTFAGSGFVLKTAGARNVSATDVARSFTNYTADVTVNPAALDRFGITGTPASVAAGSAFASPVTVTAYDAYDNVKTDYTGTVNFTGTAAWANYPADYAFTGGDSGAHAFTGSGFILYTTGSRTITVEDTVDPLKAGTSAPITVDPGSLDHFTVAGTPASTAAGSAFASPVTVTAYDAYDNVKTDYTGTVNFTGTAAWANYPADYAFTIEDAGVRAFAGSGFVLYSSGSQTLTVKDTVQTTRTGTSLAVTVNPGNLDHFDVSAIVTQTAGTPFSVTFTAKDAYGNTRTAYDGTTASLTTNEGSLSPTTASFTNGAATVSVTMTLAGSGRTLTVTDTGAGSTNTGTAGTSNAFTVDPAGLSYVVIRDAAGNGGNDVTGLNTTLTSGGSVTLYAAGYDAYDNYIADQTGAVWTSEPGANALFTLSVTNGAATVTHKKAGDPKWVQASVTGATEKYTWIDTN